MRLTFFRHSAIALLVMSCGGNAEVNDGENEPSGGDATGGQPGAMTGGSSGVGGTSEMNASGGHPSSGGASSGGSSSGGASTGGASTGGASTGGASTGGASTGGGAGAGGAENVAPEHFGHVDESCGAYNWSLDGETFLDCRIGAADEFHPDCVVVDCTEHGDAGAICVFSSHCLCSDDFACEGGESIVGSECEPRVSCVPVE